MTMTCTSAVADATPENPEAPAVDIHHLMAERRALDARRKTVVDEVEARIKAIDEQLWPLFTDDRPRLEDDGYTLTRVVPEPKTVVTWDIERAIAERGKAMAALLSPYRTEQVKTSRPYLKATIRKEAAERS